MILYLPLPWQNAQNKYSNRLFLHKPSDSEFLTYPQYAADSLPCFAQKQLYYSTWLYLGSHLKAIFYSIYFVYPIKITTFVTLSWPTRARWADILTRRLLDVYHPRSNFATLNLYQMIRQCWRPWVMFIRMACILRGVLYIHLGVGQLHCISQ